MLRDLKLEIGPTERRTKVETHVAMREREGALDIRGGGELEKASNLGVRDAIHGHFIEEAGTQFFCLVLGICRVRRQDRSDIGLILEASGELVRKEGKKEVKSVAMGFEDTVFWAIKDCKLDAALVVVAVVGHDRCFQLE